MFRKLPLFFALSLLPCFACGEVYRCQNSEGFYVNTGEPCASDNDAAAAPGKNPSESSSHDGQAAPVKSAYTKDVVAMRSPDPATRACFDHINTTEHFPDPSTTKLLSSSKKWVAVKDVGGRQMVTIGVTSTNEAGMYLGVETFKCLLMGDNITINTGDYELL